MRRVGAIVAMAMLLTLTVAAPAIAKRPSSAPVVTSVTVTETGGIWPNCEQDAVLAYTSGPVPGYVQITPWREGTWWIRDYRAKVPRGTGTITFAITWDYSQDSEWATTPGWHWQVATWSLVTPPTPQSITTTYDFKGDCPAPGTILATGPEPLPTS